MKRRRIFFVLFALYCALMLWLLFHRPERTSSLPYWQQIQGSLNLVPFRTLRLFSRLLDDHRPALVQAAIINLVGNIVMFVPLGLLPPLLWINLRKLWRTLLTAALIITAVEIVQLFTLTGSCDVDDLILNLIGAGLGYGLFTLIRKPDC